MRNDPIRVGFVIINKETKQVPRTGSSYRGHSMKLYTTEGRAWTSLRSSRLKVDQHTVVPVYATV